MKEVFSLNFLERLEQLSLERGITNNHKLADLSGVPYTTIDNFYRKGYENVKLSTLKKLANFFGCTLDFLCNGDLGEIKKEALIINKDFSKKETQIILAYRKASSDDKEAVCCILRKYAGSEEFSESIC